MDDNTTYYADRFHIILSCRNQYTESLCTGNNISIVYLKMKKYKEKGTSDCVERINCIITHCKVYTRVVKVKGFRNLVRHDSYKRILNIVTIRLSGFLISNFCST